MTRQMADDEVLLITETAAKRLRLGVAGPLTADALLRAVAALQAERDALRDDVKLLTHKVITCGVAAANPDPELSYSGPYGGEWDSPQAQDVRALRSRAERAESALEALRGQVAGLVKLASRHEGHDPQLRAALLAIKERMQ